MIKRLVLAASVCLSALLISSCGGGGTSSGVSTDTGSWSEQQDAAWNALNDINPTSVSENVEYGGWVYLNADATYSFLDPVRGTVNAVNIGSPDQVPAGAVAKASYHTHGGDDPRFDSETFSPADLITDNLWRVDGYLATPLGIFKYHSYLTGEVLRLGTVAN